MDRCLSEWAIQFWANLLILHDKGSVNQRWHLVIQTSWHWKVIGHCHSWQLCAYHSIYQEFFAWNSFNFQLKCLCCTAFCFPELVNKRWNTDSIQCDTHYSYIVIQHPKQRLQACFKFNKWFITFVKLNLFMSLLYVITQT